MKRAMAGVQRAYFNTPMEPGHLKAASVFTTVATQQKLKTVVAMSQWLANPYHPSLHTREVWYGDQLLNLMPNTDITTINVGFFADNEMQTLVFAAQFGRLMIPYGSGRNAAPSNEDIAAVVAEILARPEGHAGKTYRPTGPKLLSPQDIAAVIGKVLGRDVQYINAPIAVMSKVMRGMGYSDFATAQFEQYLLDYQKDAFAVNAPTDVVPSIIGREAEDYETIVRRYVSTMLDVKPKLSKQIQLMSAMPIWMLRRPNTSPYLGLNDFSDPKRFILSANSTEWQQDHDFHRQPAT